VPSTGYYLVVARATWAGNTTGARQLNLIKNISDVAYSFGPALNNLSTGTSMFINQIVSATASDFFTLSVYHNSGGNLDIFNGLQDTFFAIQYLGA
jgi:hypothetical protein